MAESIIITEQTYPEIMKGIKRQAKKEDRTPTKMATILIDEAISKRNK